MYQTTLPIEQNFFYCLGMRMYPLYESLLHLPSACMVASAMPRTAAVVAAPIWIEWPEKCVQSTPAVGNISHSLFISFCLEK